MLPSPAVLLVGLTGGIGSGKSTVSASLAERGAVVIDADAITRELQEPGGSVLGAMVERFGRGIVAADGTLDRRAVAEVVFQDDAALADLNAIVHPSVGAEIARRLEVESRTDHVVVLDVPLLVEASQKEEAGERTSTLFGDLAGLVVVDTDLEVAVARLVEHRGFSEADARARMARQVSRQARLARADIVVPNDGSMEELAAEIERVWEWILALASNQR